MARYSSAMYYVILLTKQFLDALEMIQMIIETLENCDEETDFEKRFNLYKEEIQKRVQLEKIQEECILAINALISKEARLDNTIDFFYRLEEEIKDAIRCIHHYP